MTDETILSRRLALGRIGAIALTAFAVPTLLTTTVFAEDGKNGDGGDTGGEGGDDKNGGDTGGDGGDDKNGGDDPAEPDDVKGSDDSGDNSGDDSGDATETPVTSLASLFKKKRKGKKN